MSLPSELKDLIGGSDKSIEQKIVEELLNEANLDTKTELNKPNSWDCISIIKEFLENKKLPISAKILEQFRKILFRYLISKDRKGRIEYLDALKGLKPENHSLNNSNMGIGGLK